MLGALIGGACAFVLQTYLVRWSSDRTVGCGIGGADGADGRNLCDARSHQGGLSPLAGWARLSLVRSEGGALLHAGRLAEADDRPSSGVVQRNHHLAARSAQSGEWSDAAGYFGQPRP